MKDSCPNCGAGEARGECPKCVAYGPHDGGCAHGSPMEFPAAHVIAAIGEVIDLDALPATVEMTGGNVATIYLGVPGPDGRYIAAIGPGSYRAGDEGMGSTFYATDLSIGLDDDGAIPARTAFTLDELQEAVKETLLDADERFATEAFR